MASDSRSPTGNGTDNNQTWKGKLAVNPQTKKDYGPSKEYRPSKGDVAIKWISTFVLATLLLASVTHSKISAIAISENMHRLTSKQGPETVQAACRMFVILFLIVLIPNGINLLRGIWQGLFRKDIPWPRKRSFVVGFFICAIETFGTCIFVMKIPSMTHPYMVILLTNCVFIMHVGVALYNAVFRRANQSTQTSVSQSKKSVFFGIAFVLELTGIGLTVTLWIVTKHSTALENIWYPVAGIVCLSIAWVPEIQSFLLQPTEKENHADNTINQNSQQETSDGGNCQHGDVSMNIQTTGNANESNNVTNRDQNQDDVGSSNTINQNSQQETSDGGNCQHGDVSMDIQTTGNANESNSVTNRDQNQDDVGSSNTINQNSQQETSDGGNCQHGDVSMDIQTTGNANESNSVTNRDQNQDDVGSSNSITQNSQQETSDGENRQHGDVSMDIQTTGNANESNSVTNRDQNQDDVGSSNTINQNSQQETSDGGNCQHGDVSIDIQTTGNANESNSVTNRDQNQDDVGSSNTINQNSQQETSDGGNCQHGDVSIDIQTTGNANESNSDTNRDQNQDDVGSSNSITQNSQQETSDGGNRQHGDVSIDIQTTGNANESNSVTNRDQNQDDVGSSNTINQNSQQETSDGGNRQHGDVSIDIQTTGNANESNSATNRDQNQRETSENGNCDSDKTEFIALEKPTWKMVIYMSFLKIVFTFVFSFILLRFAIFDSSVDAAAVSEHFKSGWYGWEGFEIYYFIANSCSSLLGYVIGFIACTTCMQKGAYAMPLFLATPLVAVLYSAYESCVGILHPGDSGDMCALDGVTNILLLVGACLCLVFAQFFSFGYLIIKSQPLVKQSEAQLFWFPTYNPMLLEQWLLLSNRNEHNDETKKHLVEKANKTRVYICTTMYREADYEMLQLLDSLKKVQRDSRHDFESHIFFDGAVKTENPTDFVLQLVALVQETLGLQLSKCTKVKTPYGMSISWEQDEQNKMEFKIHLKDNIKVKNKKRWSQIMYMSYVLDYLMLQPDKGSVGQQVSGLTGTGTQSGTGSGNSQQGSVGQQPSGLTGTGSQSSTGTVQQPSSLTRTGSQSGEGQGAMYGQTTTGSVGQQVSGLTGTGTQSGTGSGNSQQGSVGQQPSGLTGTGSQSGTGTVQQPSSLTRTGSQSGEGQGAMYGQTTSAKDDDTYILTTDADVRFTPDAVEALLDLMKRDPSVGAVCARTHPLGSGLIVWYQVFEYAIGHWFQKAAEHVLGSVLCAPGCFSVYRCKALRDVLPEYAENVEHAFDFLTKDMGEDRWLCTLMVQKGWRIEYCAASENSTHCPEEFEEFFMQRRRWIASTLANMMLLMKKWNKITRFNHRVSAFFLLYQAVLLFATLIGPSSVILVVSGGLVYGWGIDAIASLVLQIVTCVLFVMVCLLASHKAQIIFAKFLTFVYAIVMTAVGVGVAVEVATDFSSWDNIVPAIANTTSTATINPNLISSNIRVSTTAVYLGVMAGLYLMTGILHLKEGLYLIHGIWYLLCLPSGYLILILYSICNITDRSWGTREAQTKSVLSSNLSWQDTIKSLYRSFCFCCSSTTTSSSTPTKRHTEREVGGTASDRLDITITIGPTSNTGEVPITVEQSCCFSTTTSSSTKTTEREVGGTSNTGEVPNNGDPSASPSTDSRNQESNQNDQETTLHGTSGQALQSGTSSAISQSGPTTGISQSGSTFKQPTSGTGLSQVGSVFQQPSTGTGSETGLSQVGSQFQQLSGGIGTQTSNGQSGSVSQQSSGLSGTGLTPGSGQSGTISQQPSGLSGIVIGNSQQGSVVQQPSGLTGTGTQPGTGSGNSQQGSVVQQPSGLTGTGSQSGTGTVQQLSSLTGTGSQTGGGQGAMYGQTTTGSNTPEQVGDWLGDPDLVDLKDKYTNAFKDNGFDNTMMISGMTEKELKDIGIETKGTRHKLLQAIQRLTDFEIIAEVPKDVSTWLKNIGLEQYKADFEREQIETSKQMEVLKSFGRREIEKELKITKKGHVKRLLYAIRMLRNPTKGERKIIETRMALEIKKPVEENKKEHEYWEQLREECLKPSSTAFALEEDLKQRLGGLRNEWLMIFAVSNTLWLILISTLASHGELLNVFGSNFVGLLVVVLFTFVLIVQFLAMVVHRFGTLTHYLARADTPPRKSSEADGSGTSRQP